MQKQLLALLLCLASFLRERQFLLHCNKQFVQFAAVAYSVFDVAVLLLGRQHLLPVNNTGNQLSEFCENDLHQGHCCKLHVVVLGFHQPHHNRAKQRCQAQREPLWLCTEGLQEAYCHKAVCGQNGDLHCRGRVFCPQPLHLFELRKPLL